MDRKMMICDDCKHLFSFEQIKINESIVKIGNEDLTLVYFLCPRCNKVYRVTLKDAQYEELAKDIERTKVRARKARNDNRCEGLANTLDGMVIKKTERLQRYAMKLNASFMGTFTFTSSENNQKEKIKYLPQRTWNLGGKQNE